MLLAAFYFAKMPRCRHSSYAMPRAAARHGVTPYAATRLPRMIFFAFIAMPRHAMLPRHDFECRAMPLYCAMLLFELLFRAITLFRRHAIRRSSPRADDFLPAIDAAFD